MPLPTAFIKELRSKGLENFWLLLLVNISSKLPTTTLRFPRSSSMNTTLSKFSKFPMSFISIPLELFVKVVSSIFVQICVLNSNEEIVNQIVNKNKSKHWLIETKSFLIGEFIFILKGQVKAFDDFKNKQQKRMKSFSWYVKVCILLNCIQYTIHWDKTQILQIFPTDKINGTKNALFFSRAPTHHSFTFNLRFLYQLKHKVRLSKTVCGISHFLFRFVFIKVYIFVQQNAWILWL